MKSDLFCNSLTTHPHLQQHLISSMWLLCCWIAWRDSTALRNELTWTTGMHHTPHFHFNLVILFDDKGNPGDLNACKGDKASASLNSKIEAANLRGNNNFYSSVSARAFLPAEKSCVKIQGPPCLPIMKGLLKPEIGYIPDWAALWQTDRKLRSV